MRKLLLTAGFVVGLCILSIVFAGENEQKKSIPPKSNALDIEAIVEGLTNKIVALEKRIEMLEESQQTPFVNPYIITMPRSVPEGWREREFNGIPFYIVPLGEEQSKR